MISKLMWNEDGPNWKQSIWVKKRGKKRTGQNATEAHNLGFLGWGGRSWFFDCGVSFIIVVVWGGSGKERENVSKLKGIACLWLFWITANLKIILCLFSTSENRGIVIDFITLMLSFLCYRGDTSSLMTAPLCSVLLQHWWCKEKKQRINCKKIGSPCKSNLINIQGVLSLSLDI